MVAGSQRLFQEPLRFHAGTPAQLRCGGPLEIELTADKRSATTSIPKKTASDSDFVLRIGARVVAPPEFIRLARASSFEKNRQNGVHVTDAKVNDWRTATWSLAEGAPARTHGEYQRISWAGKSA
jgi:hypothetical protein